HSHAARHLRAKGRWQQWLETVRIDSVIDENAPIDDTTNHRDSHCTPQSAGTVIGRNTNRNLPVTITPRPAGIAGELEPRWLQSYPFVWHTAGPVLFLFPSPGGPPFALPR